MLLRQLEPVIKESNGFQFGKPIRADEKSLSVVLPILQTQAGKRRYVTYSETDLVHVKDTGAIEEMIANNKSEHMVFMRSGTIFTGGTQTRALQRSAVILSKTLQKLKVHCIYRSKGIQTGASVKFGGFTTHDFDSQVYGDGYASKGQSKFWDAAQKTSSKYSAMIGGTGVNPEHGDHLRVHGRSMYSGDVSFGGLRRHVEEDVSRLAGFTDCSIAGSSGPSIDRSFDDLETNINKFSESFDQVLSKVKRVEYQAGLALLNPLGVETIELFDHPDSWEALHQAAVKRIGSNIVQKDDESVFEYKPEIAKRQVCKVLGLDWDRQVIFEHKPGVDSDRIKILGISADGYVGEIVEINDCMIHCVILKKAEAKK